jgi:signal transduction histidine kinase
MFHNFRIRLGFLLCIFLSQAIASMLADDAPIIAQIGQFQGLSGGDFLSGRALDLTGVVTMVDTNRGIIAMQDGTGAVAVHLALPPGTVSAGQLIRLQSPNCSPYCAQLPDFPFSPSGWDLRTSFEAPTNWGDYHLTRMRGFLHPPVSGEYTFWIASDNSSDLWLGSDANPGNVKRIAFIERGNWVHSREWSRYPSQRSEPVPLVAGRFYYIEAVQEQLLEDDNIAVAWRGPSIPQSVIDGSFLVPWSETLPYGSLSRSNGILREYWTNYSVGAVEGVSGPRPFDSVITPRAPKLAILGRSPLPAAARLNLNQPLSPDDNFRWADVEGDIAFAGADNGSGLIELVNGSSGAQVNVASVGSSSMAKLPGGRVRVEGVCEGTHGVNGELRIGFIWTPSSEQILPANQLLPIQETAIAPSNSASRLFGSRAIGGFYWTHGIVTFDGHAQSKDYLVIQEPSAAVFIAQTGRNLSHPLQVGELVEMGGSLVSGDLGPEVYPMIIHERGWAPMPEPAPAPRFPAIGRPDGLWTELEGIVHAINADGSLLLMTQGGPVNVWIGQAWREPAKFVDAKLRIHGDLLLSRLARPILLTPSARFVDVEEPPVENPFAAPLRSVQELESERLLPSFGHRVRLKANVTYQFGSMIFAQDSSGGIRVRLAGDQVLDPGQPLTIAAFPEVGSQTPILTEAVTRPAHIVQDLHPTVLDLSRADITRYDAGLVTISATLLDEKFEAGMSVLELQAGQHMFEAILARERGTLPKFHVESVLGLTGVLNLGASDALVTEARVQIPATASFTLLLRSPSEAIVLRGPPWWTWKRAVTLICALSSILFGAVLWIRLLRRRLQKQQAAQLAFSRQILHSQESERRRIAANLHDSLGQNLLVIKNQACLAMQSASDAAQLRRRLDEISGVASQAIDDVRQITWNLRPYQLDRLGMTEAVRAAISVASENSEVLFATHVDAIDDMFDAESEIHVFRIVQESVNNILKHSAATEAAVVIKRHAASLTLSIRDNGHGFDAAAPAANRGYGLNGITERLRILGGTLNIDSSPDQGTTITAEIPLPANHHAKRTQSADRR